MSTALLQGLRIIEFSAFVAAPSAGLALAESAHPQPQLGRLVCIGPRGALDGRRIRALLDAAACSAATAGTKPDRPPSP